MGIYSQEIARGAEVLDGLRPGWRNEIDLDRLNLANLCDCVLGQLDLDGVVEGGYNRALGFDVPEPCRLDKYVVLTEEWREYIRETRTAVTA